MIKSLQELAKSFTVLFVEDESDAREMGSGVFKLLFENVFVADNGEAGLRLYKEKNPDIVITDIQMPLMNGLDMIKEIRADNKDIPIIVTTAHSDEKYMMESIKLGIDRYVLKPIAKDECMDAIMAITKKLHDKKKAEKYAKERMQKEIESIAKLSRRHAMRTDKLTGLGNRYSLTKILSYVPEASLAVVNLDRFKEVNKIYGVKIGDAVIAKVADLLVEWCNQRCGFKVFRLGGDEFALYFVEACPLELESAALEIIERIEDSVFVVDGIELDLSATIGISYGSKRPIEDAETALRMAKQKKKKLLAFKESFLDDEEHKNNIFWYRNFKDAIKNDRIVPYYQAIVDTKTKKISKYECLVRLLQPDGSAVSPYSFLDIIKKTRMYEGLTSAIVKKSIEHFSKNDYSFSINLSAEDILNEEISEMIIESVKTSGVGNRIVFEILESEGIENFEEVGRFIEALKGLGCRFSIDDFGTGYSNFAYLLRLDVDYLKIDGSLIRNLVHDENSRKVVATINTFAHSIGLETIAEFVSSKEIYEEVAKLGIDYCQGYYFAEPKPGIL